MTKLAFVDGYRNGRSFGEARPFCQPCHDKQYPHRDNPIGHELRTLRLEHGLSLGEVARSLGVSPVDVSEVETGKVAPPDRNTINQWKEKLGAASGDTAP